MVTYFAKWLERYGTMGKYGFMDLFGKKSWSKPDRIHLGLLWLLEHLYRHTNHELLSSDFVVWIFAECPVCGWCSIPAVQRRLWGWSLVSCQMSGGSWCDAATRTGLIHWRDFFFNGGEAKVRGKLLKFDLKSEAMSPLSAWQQACLLGYQIQPQTKL